MASVLRWLPLGLLAVLTSCGPVYRAWAAPGPPVPFGSAEPDPRRLLGTWALTDNDNLLWRHWATGADRQGPASSERQGDRL